MVQEVGELADHRLGLSRGQPLQIACQRGKQLSLVDDLRQRDQQEDKQRHDRQQRVIRNGARQQQPLIRTKGAQDAQRERSRVHHHVRGLLSECSHQSAPGKTNGERPPDKKTAGKE